MSVEKLTAHRQRCRDEEAEIEKSEGRVDNIRVSGTQRQREVETERQRAAQGKNQMT